MGSRVGAYELGREIGRGGMGRVVEARAPSGVRVALKLVPAPKTEEERVRFDRERRLLADLAKTSGFVPLLDAGQERDACFLVMPLLTGGTLRDRMKRGPLPLDETIALAHTLAAALAAAHAQGIVHRDLKPENVLYTADGQPLLADLGLAKHFRHDAPGASASHSITREGTLKGTFGYMPVEQMRDAKSAGPSSDVFGVGAILYECLAGEPAFAGESLLELADAVASGWFVPLARARPDAPAWLRAVVERAIASDADARYADGAALLAALAGHARPPSFRGVASRAVPVALVATVAAIAVVFALGRSAPRPAREPPPAPAAPVAAPAASPAAFLAAARAGFASDAAREEALAALAAAGDVAAVGSALDEVSADLRRVTREAYVAVKEPLPAEEQAYLASPLDGIEAAVDARLALEPGERLEAPVASLLARAERRMEDRAARVLGAVVEAPPARALVADRQRDALGPARVALARFLCDALAAMDHPSATGALVRYLLAEEDEDRAARAGVALARKGDERALAAIATARRRFGKKGAYWAAVRAALPKAPPPADTARGHLDHGASLLELGDFSAAEAEVARAIELDPGLARAHFVRACARYRRGDTAGALVDLESALARDDRDPAAWITRAEVRRDRGDLEGALEDAARAIALDPNDAWPWSLRATIRRDRGEDLEAERDATRAIELDPREPKAFRARGYARLALGKVEPAIADLERFVELAPNHQTTPRAREQIARLKRGG